METNKSPFNCPQCGAQESVRERRINGNSLCINGHTYPSKDAVVVVDADMLTPERMEYVAGAVAAAWTKNDMQVQARRCKDAAATIRAAADEIVRLRKRLDCTLGDEDFAETAYWNFDARRKGLAAWKGRPMSERDAFKAELRVVRHIEPTEEQERNG